MSRYDGLIIPRNYSEYINKTDAATLLQALQLSGVMDATPTQNSNHPIKSSGVFAELKKLQTISRFLFQTGVVTAGIIPITEGYNDNSNIYLENNKIKFRGDARYLVTTHIVGSTDANTSGRLWYQVKGTNIESQHISYGEYATGEIAILTQVSSQQELYVNLLQDFRLSGGSTGASYIELLQM